MLLPSVIQNIILLYVVDIQTMMFRELLAPVVFKLNQSYIKMSTHIIMGLDPSDDVKYCLFSFLSAVKTCVEINPLETSIPFKEGYKVFCEARNTSCENVVFNEFFFKLTFGYEEILLSCLLCVRKLFDRVYYFLRFNNVYPDVMTNSILDDIRNTLFKLLGIPIEELEQFFRCKNFTPTENANLTSMLFSQYVPRTVRILEP